MSICVAVRSMFWLGFQFGFFSVFVVMLGLGVYNRVPTNVFLLLCYVGKLSVLCCKKCWTKSHEELVSTQNEKRKRLGHFNSSHYSSVESLESGIDISSVASLSWEFQLGPEVKQCLQPSRLLVGTTEHLGSLLSVSAPTPSPP